MQGSLPSSLPSILTPHLSMLLPHSLSLSFSGREEEEEEEEEERIECLRLTHLCVCLYATMSVISSKSKRKGERKTFVFDWLRDGMREKAPQHATHTPKGRARDCCISPLPSFPPSLPWKSLVDCCCRSWRWLGERRRRRRRRRRRKGRERGREV